MTRRILLTAALLPLLASVLGADTPKPVPTARDAKTLRVMTYNIHITQGMDKKFDPQRIADVIKAADVDVVALQEVDIGARRSGKVDQVAELAKLTGMHGMFGKARDHDGGEYGQAILSRQPIERLDVHKLPGAAGQEERIALIASIKQPKPLPDLLFVGTHLHHQGEEHRLPQAAELNVALKDHVGKPNPAVIVLGDLNATPDSKVMNLLGETWDDVTAKSGMTFPANKPDRKIDYILLPKGHKWEVVSAKVIDEPVASDHRPVVVELRWTGQ